MADRGEEEVLVKKALMYLIAIVTGSLLAGFLISKVEKRREKKRIKQNRMEEDHQPYGKYEACLKRPLDFAIAFTGLLFLFPVYLILAALVRVKLGNPILFTQDRPGKDGKIFKLYKFRTMTDERDGEGELLPDEKRLTEFGKWLRSTSLDELPELFNILKGDMSFVGPRPLLVEYLPLYNERQARRHEVRPGLTGLAQVSGRNSLSWKEKFELDVIYVDSVSFWGDLKIILETLAAVLKREGINSETAATMEKFRGEE